MGLFGFRTVCGSLRSRKPIFVPLRTGSEHRAQLYYVMTTPAAILSLLVAAAAPLWILDLQLLSRVQMSKRRMSNGSRIGDHGATVAVTGADEARRRVLAK